VRTGNDGRIGGGGGNLLDGTVIALLGADGIPDEGDDHDAKGDDPGLETRWRKEDGRVNRGLRG
jgi:hypothetical protein